MELVLTSRRKLPNVTFGLLTTQYVVTAQTELVVGRTTVKDLVALRWPVWSNLIEVKLKTKLFAK